MNITLKVNVEVERKLQEAAALNDDMRRLMDEYQWVVRGRVGPRPPRDPAARDWMGRVPIPR